MLKKKSEAEIVDWIKTKKLGEFGKYVMSATVHGEAGIPVGEIVRIGKILNKNFSERELVDLSHVLVKRSEYTSRRIGAPLLVHGWARPGTISKWLLLLAEDPNWMVRETAAGVFGSLLDKDFKTYSQLFLNWISTESVNVKRAIALAVKYDSKSADLKRWPSYFNLIDPLMQEEAEYIRKNLGPFAIGDGLLGRFPKQTLLACHKWNQSSNENVKWNTAMIFTAAAARAFAKDGLKILVPLSQDQNRFVSAAAQNALRKLKMK